MPLPISAAIPGPAPRPAPGPESRPSTGQPLWILILAAGSIVGLAMGIRNIMGLYMPPVTQSLGIGRETFGLAMAIANIVWGIGAPFAGAISDKYGCGRVIVGGALTTMTGLYLMYAASSGTELLISGLLLGLGISGTGVTTILGTVGQKAPAEKRMFAMSAVSIGSGLGILCALPYAHLLIEYVGWRESLLVLAATLGIMVPLAWVLSGKPAAPAANAPKAQTLKEALQEAFSLPSFWMLTAGYFVCGFHVTFYSVHLPAFVVDQGMPRSVATAALMAVGVFNIIGTVIFSRLSDSIGKRGSLSLIYLLRAFVFLGFLYLPMTPTTVIALSAAIGILWLTTVPLTTAMVATFFGTTWLAMLGGIVFFSHQVGSFLGVWAAGWIYDTTKSYDMVWWISVGLGLFAALMHWPIKEQPVARIAGAAQPQAA
jgi:predicted MFS family arabinose efflux permease